MDKRGVKRYNNNGMICRIIGKTSWGVSNLPLWTKEHSKGIGDRISGQ